MRQAPWKYSLGKKHWKQKLRELQLRQKGSVQDEHLFAEFTMGVTAGHVVTQVFPERTSGFKQEVQIVAEVHWVQLELQGTQVFPRA